MACYFLWSVVKLWEKTQPAYQNCTFLKSALYKNSQLLKSTNSFPPTLWKRHLPFVIPIYIRLYVNQCNLSLFILHDKHNKKFLVRTKMRLFCKHGFWFLRAGVVYQQNSNLLYEFWFQTQIISRSIEKIFHHMFVRYLLLLFTIFLNNQI